MGSRIGSAGSKRFSKPTDKQHLREKDIELLKRMHPNSPEIFIASGNTLKENRFLKRAAGGDRG